MMQVLRKYRFVVKLRIASRKEQEVIILVHDMFLQNAINKFNNISFEAEVISIFIDEVYSLDDQIIWDRDTK